MFLECISYCQRNKDKIQPVLMTDPKAYSKPDEQSKVHPALPQPADLPRPVIQNQEDPQNIEIETVALAEAVHRLQHPEKSTCQERIRKGFHQTHEQQRVRQDHGKTICKRVNVRPVIEDKKLLKLTFKPTFVSSKIFNNNFVAVHKVKETLDLNISAYSTSRRR